MRKFISGLLSVAVLTGVMTPAVGAAGSASLNFSAKSGSYKSGNSFTLNVVENSGSEGVNVIEANFLFDESKLQLVGKSCNSAVFGVTAPGQGNGITCGSYAPVMGAQVVASVTFKALADGAVSLGFAHTSRVYEAVNGTDVWNQDPSYSNFTVTTPVAQPVAKKASAPATTQTTTAAPATPAPATEEVKAAETVTATDQKPAEQPAVIEDDTVSVWAYLAVFLGATALAAGVVYRDNLKKWATQLRGSFGAKAVPVAAVATAAAAKKKTTKKPVAKKKPAAKKK
jgi:hypothetical protein